MESNKNEQNMNQLANAPQEAQVVDTPKVEPEVVKADYFRNKRKAYNTVQKMEMPSGIYFEIRRPDIVRLIKNGIIPADAAVDLSNLMEQAASTRKNGGEFKMTGEQFKKYCDILDEVAIASIVSPQVKKGMVTEAEYDDNIISVDDIDQEDKEFIFAYANAGVTDLKPFREKE